MSKQFKNGTCSCWEQCNRELAKHNARLSGSFSLSGHDYLNVATENIVKSRNRPKTVVASYCPFCGKKLRGQR